MAAISSNPDVTNELESVSIFQKAIYGDIDELHIGFPLSINRDEAGPSAVMSTDGGQIQRRNLWIDSFGILNYVSLAMGYKNLGDHQKTQKYLRSAEALIKSVYAVLGTPRSVEFPMTLSFSNEGGFKGLRNGSVHSRQGDSDVGMEFDGLSLHCLDKFLFALCRYARCLDEPSAKAGIISRAVKLIKDTHPHFLVPHVGYMSKVNTDMSPISTLLHATSPSHDTVKAFVVYKIVEAEGGNVASEVADLFPLVMTYFQRHPSDLLLETYDALNIGSHLWTLQFLEPVFLPPAATAAASLTGTATTPSSEAAFQEWGQGRLDEHASISIAQHPLVENTLFRYAEEIQCLAKSVLKGELTLGLGSLSSTEQRASSEPPSHRVLFGLLGAELVVSLWHPTEETKKKTTPSSSFSLLPPPLGTLAAPSSPPHSALSTPSRESGVGGTTINTPSATEGHGAPLATFPHADLYLFARNCIESIATKQLRSLQMEAATAPSSPSRRTRPTETKNAVDLVTMSATLLPSAWKSLPHERFFSIYAIMK